MPTRESKASGQEHQITEATQAERSEGLVRGNTRSD